MSVPLSLIIPSYNVENHIGEALQSVKRQTLDYSLFEVIIVDDGSVDNTPKIIEREIRGMKNVKFIKRKENKGISYTKNEAIENSRGGYITILESDDVLKEISLNRILSFMNSKPNIHYSYSGHRRINSNGIDVGEERVNDFFSRKKLLHYNFVGHLRCFTRKIHDSIGGFDETLDVCEDWDHVLKASEIVNENCIKHLPEILYLYRLHESNISRDLRNMAKKGKLVIRNSLKRKEGLDVIVSFLGKKGRNDHSYYDWRSK